MAEGENVHKLSYYNGIVLYNNTTDNIAIPDSDKCIRFRNNGMQSRVGGGSCGTER